MVCNAPKVSIIIPTFNRAVLLMETLDSVLKQSFGDFEILVVDHGSSDNTAAILQRYQDTRVRSIHVDRREKLSHVRNRGLASARGQMIAFLDSDDLWEPDKLRQQTGLLEAYPDVGFVQCGLHVFDETRTRSTDLQLRASLGSGDISIGWLFPAVIRAKMAMYTSTILIRRSAIDLAGPLNEELRAGECEFITRLSFHCRGAIIHRPLVRIRKHAGNTSALYWEQDFEEALYTIERFNANGAISPDIYAEMMSLYHRRYAECLAARGRHEEAKTHFSACLRDLA
jgi:glycosyltransferase involved in cell wall biosynthesis